MTRETLPRFDLYGELEVSPFASVGTIEAAYRALVKQHHPDVASGDEARMRRLNLAREWLTDPELRARYDRETDRGRRYPAGGRSAVTHSVVTRSNPAWRPSSGVSGPTGGSNGSAAPSEPTFGIHADEVRQFLAELRSLDRGRAQRVWNGRAVAHTKGYTQALRAAASAARGDRAAEWRFAREAAAVIARGKLGDSTLADQVADVLSDVAGAIAIRDLLSPAEFALVLMPWTWRGTVKLPEVDVAPAARQGSGTVTGARELADAVPVQPEPPRPSAPAPPAPPAPAVASTASVAPRPSVAPPPPVVPPPLEPRPAAPSPIPASPPIASSPRSSPRPAAPFTAALPPPSQPPTWPTRPAEPNARPPIDPAASERFVAGLAAKPRSSAAANTIGAAAVAGASPSIRLRPAPPRAAVYAPPQRQRVGALPVALAAASLVLLLGAAVLIIPTGRTDQAVAGLTDAPTATLIAIVPGSAAPPTIDPTVVNGASEAPAATTGPSATSAPVRTQKPTARPIVTPKPTKRPTPAPSPTPSPNTTPSPTVPPPTSPPTSTPGTMCTVVSLINVWTFDAQADWAKAGFTGTVVFNPAPPPDYHIKTQNLAVGAVISCSSGVIVTDGAP